MTDYYTGSLDFAVERGGFRVRIKNNGPRFIQAWVVADGAPKAEYWLGRGAPDRAKLEALVSDAVERYETLMKALAEMQSMRDQAPASRSWLERLFA